MKKYENHAVTSGLKKKPFPATFWINHLLLIALVVLLFLPGLKPVKSVGPMLASVVIIEIIYLVSLIRKSAAGKKTGFRASSDLMVIVWSFMIIWELMVTKLNLCHPVLIPAPENVFYVFYDRPIEILKGIGSSMELLLSGIILGVAMGVILGLICGWVTRLRELLYPIANVLAPIPTIVYSPYIVALMPSFRSASFVVIFLGIFWPTFLRMIVSVDSMDKGILELAKTLKLKNMQMIFQVLLPYTFPGVISGLKITLTTGFMLLTFAEMMGSTSGIGYFIVNYNTYGNYTNVVAGIIVVGIVVTILNRIATTLQKKLIKWH